MSEHQGFCLIIGLVGLRSVVGEVGLEALLGRFSVLSRRGGFDRVYVARKSVEEARLEVTGLETCRKVAAKVSQLCCD